MENKAKSPSSFMTFSKTVGASPRGTILGNITNTASSFQRSAISTSKSKNQNRNGSIDKSKIKTLPNYQRYSMGNSLPFVTIFQTIQIERLSDEIETQRIKLKEYERYMFNAANFEVQIKQLSERCTTYEDELTQYREQLDKMNKICETLYHENENIKNRQKNSDSTYKTKLEEESKRNRELSEEMQQWVKKYEFNVQARQMELQQMKAMMQKQRKSMIERQMKDQQARHQGQRAKLIIQLRRLNELLAIRETELEDVKKKHQNSQDYIKELKQYGSKLNEYEERICMLSQEHLRLSRIIDVNASELDQARKKQFKLSQKLKTDKELILDNEHLRELVEIKQKELQQWKKQIVELDQEVGKGRQLFQINSELSAKLACLSEENEKLAKLLRERSSQIQRWKNTISSLEQNSNKCREYEDLLIQHQSKYKVLQVENERLEATNKIRVREIEELKNRLMATQNDGTTVNRLQREKKNIEDKYKAQVQRIMDLEMYIQKSDEELKILRQSANRLQSSESVVQSLKKENERLQQKISQYDKELTNLKQFEAELGKQYVKMKQNDGLVSQYQSKLAIMNDEISRLSEMLKNKNEEIVRLQDQKISNYTFVNQYNNIQAALDQKDRTILKLKTDLDGYQTKIGGYEKKMEEIDSKNQELFSTMTEQLQTMEQEVKKKNKQCDQLRTKQAKIQNQLLQSNQVQQLNSKLQNRITVYLRDLQDLRIQNKQYETTLSDTKKQCIQLQSELKKLKTTSTEQQLGQSIHSESRKSTQSQRSALSGSNSNTTVDPTILLHKISQLQLTLNDLKINYSELLKQVGGGSASTIKTTSSNTNSNSSSMIQMV